MFGLDECQQKPGRIGEDGKVILAPPRSNTVTCISATANVLFITHKNLTDRTVDLTTEHDMAF